MRNEAGAGSDVISELSDGASPDEAFRYLLSKVVQPQLKQSGFKKSGSTFHSWPSPEACKVVNFQRSSGSTSQRIRFTVNLGVYLSCLDSQSGGGSAVDRRDPKEYDCHRRIRIGQLMPSKNDYWRDLDGKSTLDNIWKELLPALAQATEFLDTLTSPKRFLDALASGGCGLTPVMHERYVERLTNVTSGASKGHDGSSPLIDGGSISMKELAAIDSLRQVLEQNDRLDPESLRKDSRYSKTIELAERFGLDWKPGPRCGQ